MMTEPERCNDEVFVGTGDDMSEVGLSEYCDLPKGHDGDHHGMSSEHTELGRWIELTWPKHEPKRK